MSKNYRYHLLKYHGKASRLTCPQCGRPHCFTPYVDDDENIVGEEYGRCDHESSCGYVKYPPSQDESWRKPPGWLGKPQKTSKPLRKTAPEPEGDVSTIPMEIVQKTVRTNPLSAFLLFLTKLFDTDTILRVIADYLIGVTKAGDVIFFQIDIKGRCRTGKVMKYNPDTGKRIKDESQPGRITWVHTLLKKQLPEKWGLKQCLFGEHLLARYPDKPVILLGHSMGSFIARLYLSQYSEELVGAIIMGTAGPGAPVAPAVALINLISAFKGEHHRSEFIDKLAFGSYNKRIDPKRTKFDWLTKDEAVVDRYVADEKCGFLFTLSGYRDLMTFISECNRREWAESVPTNLRVLIVSGAEDPVGNYGEGPKKVAGMLAAAGSVGVTLKLFRGDRHEILNETDRESVYRFIDDWIGSVLPAPEETDG